MTRILIIDDSSECRELLKIYLKLIQPCRTEMASNGKEALDVIDNQTFEFDYIFIDIKMPVMSGYEFAEKYKGKAKLIATTAVHELHLNKEKLSLFDKILIKPISKQKIEETLKTLN